MTLFKKGEIPTLEERRKVSEGLRRYYAEHPHHMTVAHQAELDKFIAKVQVLLDECYQRMRSN